MRIYSGIYTNQIKTTNKEQINNVQSNPVKGCNDLYTFNCYSPAFSRGNKQCINNVRELLPNLVLDQNTPENLIASISFQEKKIRAILKEIEKEHYGKIKVNAIKMQLKIDYSKFHKKEEIYSYIIRELRKNEEPLRITRRTYRNIYIEAVNSFHEKMNTGKIERKTTCFESRRDILASIFGEAFTNSENNRKANTLEELLEIKISGDTTVKQLLTYALKKFDTSNEEIQKQKDAIENVFNLSDRNRAVKKKSWC